MNGISGNPCNSLEIFPPSALRPLRSLCGSALESILFISADNKERSINAYLKPFAETLCSVFMKNRLIRPGIVILMGIIFMALSNPSEEKFLMRIAVEYGAVHGGAHFNTAELRAMGESRRQSYFIFSTYEYEFGTIGVRYVGFLFSIFHIESYLKKTEPVDEDEGVLV
jgi:hypothetical protein